MLLARYGRSFIVLVIVITIVKYDHTVITFVNYDCKTFIVQATGLNVKKPVTYLIYNVSNKLKCWFLAGHSILA